MANNQKINLRNSITEYAQWQKKILESITATASETTLNQLQLKSNIYHPIYKGRQLAAFICRRQNHTLKKCDFLI